MSHLLAFIGGLAVAGIVAFLVIFKLLNDQWKPFG